MAEDQEMDLHIIDQAGKEVNSPDHAGNHNHRKYSRLFRVAMYIILLLCGQSVAVLLGRLYFEKGGKSKWMGTLVQLAGFPILMPYYFLHATKKSNSTIVVHTYSSPSSLVQVSVYVSLGLLVALDCFLYSVGLMNLPVSTYSLLSAAQLAFNAFFAFFLNRQKFTPYIVNSLVLLTTSSSLLVFAEDDSKEGVGISKSKYMIGFVCTVFASAACGLILSLTQLAFKKVFKREDFKVIMDMIVYEDIVATMVTLVGFFASGEWKGIKEEMDNYEMGKMSYVMNLTWTAISWQLFSIGSVGLILEVSALFSNSISVLALPIVPVFSVVFFHDKMHGIKVLSLVLATWGFISYGYQQYLDDYESNTEKRIASNDLKGMSLPAEAVDGHREGNDLFT